MLKDINGGIPQELMRQLVDNALVVLAKRAGGTLVISVEELDNAVEMLIMESNVADETFTFRLVGEGEGSH